ncbi:7TM diverse intracellular signaling domain-containing protein [Maridesulfovibrio salexigens]|uniref:Putative PAS/PAC sensor protein n=1 Tax=Maridesulfovibrio salexigens (strain ATCC 14822 / DSM 2638 / NCIMB 8403 / VKM B-1763) TaxID=526222 RepID=C6BV14_MARSD|nr:7TM diverse intracellular signaling domain-containing protein [Maridesulfovibrio salexigens]ACS78151.1 putative PAS/PAC sensor protein [Maridesulfovibrio salexigens DSM 2638]
MPKHKSIYTKLILLALLLVISSCVQTTDGNHLKATQGYLDLSHWNFNELGPATLDGEWEFYTDTSYSKLTTQKLAQRDFFPLPAIWKGSTQQGFPVQKQGTAVYRLKVKLPPSPVAYQLYISGMLSVCNVIVNGKDVASSGTFGSDRKSETPVKHLISPTLTPNEGYADIVIEISNFHNKEGGINSSILLGSHEQIEELINYRHISGAIIGGALLVMAVFHIVIFIMRRSSRENLYFGAFCLVWCVATVFNPPSAFLASKFFSIDWSWYIKICLIPTGLAIPLLLIFYNSVFPQRYGVQVSWIFSIIGGVYCIYTIATPPGAYSSIAFAYFLITRIAYVYLFASFINDLRKKRKGAVYLAPGYLVLACAEFDEILFDLNIFGSADFTPYGTFIFILSYSLLMSSRFAETLSSYERVSGELESRKKKEHDHKIIHLRLSKMLDSVDEAILAVNNDLVIDFCNSGFEKLSGFNCKEIQGLNLNEIIESKVHQTAFIELINKQTATDNKTTLEEISLPVAAGKTINVLISIRTIDIESEPIYVMNIRPVQAQPDKRELAVIIMNSSLEYWEKATGRSKADLASESGIWNIYIEKDGYARTQTLDRYLNIETLPERPRWKNIYATAEFVLNNSAQNPEATSELETNLNQLKKMS